MKGRLDQAPAMCGCAGTHWVCAIPDVRPFHLIANLAALPSSEAPPELPLVAAIGSATPSLPLSVILQRKPSEAVAGSHRTLPASQSAGRLGWTRTLVATEFKALAISLPAAAFPADQG